jgi:surfeit locus 1 family protein
LKRALFLSLCGALAALFAGLGIWQVERWRWKTDLIAHVDARLAAQLVPAPSFSRWLPHDAYTRVTATGVFLHDRETAVQAVTEFGPGWWIITPLRTDAGVILINRGFVSADQRQAASRAEGMAAGRVVVSGLLRATEPGGAFLRTNAPDEDRWYSRDVEAIARARYLTDPVAPYFIDADASQRAAGSPVGGLTVVRFRNSHIVYALTWFGLCALCLFAARLVWRRAEA